LNSLNVLKVVSLTPGLLLAQEPVVLTAESGLSGSLRVIIAIGGGWLALRLTGSLNWLFAALALGLIVYGVALTAAIVSGAWFGRERSINVHGYQSSARD
jgi:hypothetical protein